MKNFTKRRILFLLFMVLPSLSFGNGLIKIYKDNSEFYILPTKSILSIEVETSDKEMTLFFHAVGGGETVWRAEIENITEENSLKLIKRIYDKNRTEILSIKVNGTN